MTWNAEGYLSSRGLVRQWTPEGQADAHPPELYVIVCGVSQYAEPKLNLRFSAKDAEDMAHALELAGKRLFGADKVHLTLLSTADDPKAQKPTKDNLRQAFAAARQAKPGDVLVVYLAGHGVSLKTGRRRVLLPDGRRPRHRRDGPGGSRLCWRRGRSPAASWWTGPIRFPP